MTSKASFELNIMYVCIFINLFYSNLMKMNQNKCYDMLVNHQTDFYVLTTEIDTDNSVKLETWSYYWKQTLIVKWIKIKL